MVVAGTRVAERRGVGVAVRGAAALLICAAAILVATGVGARIGYDFRAYLTAAGALAAGHNPYHGLAQQASDSRPGIAGLHTNGYVYPPLLALLLSVPVRLGLSPSLIWLGWIALTAGAVGWAGWELARHLWGRPAWSAAGFSASLLVAAISIYDLSLGQVDLALAGLTVCAIALWLRRHPLAGVVLGACIAVKPFLAAVLLIWLWKHDWRSAIAGAVAALIFTLGPFVFVGWQGLGDYTYFLLHSSSAQGDAEFINQSLYGLLQRALAPNPYLSPVVDVPWLVLPVRLVCCLGAVVIWARAVPRSRSTDAALALTECLLGVVVMLLVSPVAEDIHYCLLLPALIACAWLAWQRRMLRHPAAWLCVVALVICWVPRMQELIYPDKLVQLPLQHDPRFGPVVTLLRSGALLWVALATLLGGAGLLRSLRCAGEGREEPSGAPAVAAVVGSPARV